MGDGEGPETGGRLGQLPQNWRWGSPLHDPFYPQVLHPNPPKTEEMNHTLNWSVSPPDTLAGPDYRGPTWRTLPCLKSMS